MLRFVRWFNSKRKPLIAILVALLATLFGQQCSRVALEKYEEIELFSTSGSPYKLDRPEDNVLRNYIFFVDMSNSMISGPCPQDVYDGFLFTSSQPNYPYDPNKGYSTNDDHRMSGVDCVVDKNMPMDFELLKTSNQFNPDIYTQTVYKTFPGIDWEGYRFKIIEKWIKDLRAQSTPESLAKTQIMLVPVSGGAAQIKLNAKMKAHFGLQNPVVFLNMLSNSSQIDSILGWMREEHGRNFAQVQNLNDEYRYETTTMGTTAPAGLLKDLYDHLQADMRKKNNSGDLPFVEYQLIFLGDGFINPLGSKTDPSVNPITKVLNLYPSCSACSSNRKTCAASCANIVARLEQAWGIPEENTMEKMDFLLSLLEGLPAYFGAGSLKLSFFQIDEIRARASRSPTLVNLFPEMKNLFKSRNSIFDAYFAKRDPTTGVLNANDFSLASSQTMIKSLQMTHLFMMNPNVRLNNLLELQTDSDGDGAFDADEVKAGYNPTKMRTNDMILDSLMIHPAYAQRAATMVETKSCHSYWDADGDSLNECEEALLGTNQFDFDSDNDAIPDYYEWVYGYNPLVPDTGLDSNGDGYLNTVAFAIGLGPQTDIRKLAANKRVIYELNKKGKEQEQLPDGTAVWVDLYEVVLRQIPVLATSVVNPKDQTSLYLARDVSNQSMIEKVRIPFSTQVTSYSQRSGMNSILALVRLVDRNYPEKAYWRVYKNEIPLTNNIKKGLLDLSQFRQVPARDRTR